MRKNIFTLKVFLGLVIVLLLSSAIILKTHHHSTNQTINVTNQTIQNVTPTQQSANSAAQSLGLNKPNTTSSMNKPAQPPEFTVYYPSNSPSGMIVDPSSISYDKDYFIFSLKQNGQNLFFINEQPVGQNFSFQRLKVKLGSPVDVDTALGKGIIGTLGSNFITAIKTNKNTLIIINCTALVCAVPSNQIVGSLAINSNPTKLKQN